MASRAPAFGDLSGHMAGRYKTTGGAAGMGGAGRLTSLSGVVDEDALERDGPFAPFATSTSQSIIRRQADHSDTSLSLYDFRRTQSNLTFPERSLFIAPTPASISRPAFSVDNFMGGDGVAELPNSLLNMSGINSPTPPDSLHDSQDSDLQSTEPSLAAPAPVLGPTSPSSSRSSRAPLQTPSQSHPSRRQQPSTSTLSQRPPPFNHAYSAPGPSPDLHPSAPGSAVSHSYPSALNYAPAHSSFGARSGFVPPYTMSHQQPPISMIQSPPQFAYSPHHPMHGPDGSMRYSSPSYAPMMHAPMYNPYGDPSSGQGITYSAGATSPSMAAFAPSPPPMSPTSGSHHAFQSQPAFGYSPARYAYAPPPSFPQRPGVYPAYGHSPYVQQQRYASGDQESQGTWYYMPNTSASFDQPSFQTLYSAHPQQLPSPLTRRSTEPQGVPQVPHTIDSPQRQQPTQSPSPAPTSVRHQPAQARLGALSPSPPAREAPTTSAPVPAHPSSSRPAPPRSSTSDRAAADVVRRKEYHPLPPVNRSEWVMWAGNVPSDATHDELWRFFNQSPSAVADPGQPSATTASASVHGGVSSIFLISRSNCAFVNFDTEEHLLAAVDRFNGQPLRPNDPRCPRLVCRVRRRTDDLKAGVGGQRGMGMHTRWVKEERARKKAAAAAASSPRVNSPQDELGAQYSSMSLSDDSRVDGETSPEITAHSNSSESFTSSNSGFLAKYFPQRFFILKSLTQYDLDLSVQEGVWATQKHNEGILNQAYHTSKDVYLIFGVNKTGEFYGYARMASDVQKSKDPIAWQARPESVSTRAIISPTENRFADASPQPVSALSPGPGAALPDPPPPAPSASGGSTSLAASRGGKTPSSAPAEMREPHRQLSHKTPTPGLSLNYQPIIQPVSVSMTNFELDTMAPVRNMRNPTADAARPSSEGQPGTLASLPEAPSQEALAERASPTARPDPVPVQPASEKRADDDAPWGHSFKVEWIRTERLPFHRTRHLRNPWNHGREVKVSRDGTELEPSVGLELIAEWDRPPPDPGETGRPAGGRRPPASHTARSPP